MEMDDEVSGGGNSYTTYFRSYDPRIARWTSLDPLAASFPHQSPYVAFDNNPIYYTDPSGAAAENGDPPSKGQVIRANKIAGEAVEKFGNNVGMKSPFEFLNTSRPLPGNEEPSETAELESWLTEQVDGIYDSGTDQNDEFYNLVVELYEESAYLSRSDPEGYSDFNE